MTAAPSSTIKRKASFSNSISAETPIVQDTLLLINGYGSKVVTTEITFLFQSVFPDEKIAKERRMCGNRR